MTGELRNAIELKIGRNDPAIVCPDTITGTVTGSSSTTVVQLTATHAARFTAKQRVNFGGGAEQPTGNLAATRTIREIDTVADTITVWPPLFVAPTAGHTVNAGLREWLQSSTAVRYQAQQFDGSVEGLIVPDAVHGGVLIWGPKSSEIGVFETTSHRLEFHAIGKNIEWLEGLIHRLVALLHRGTLTLGFATLEFMRATFSEPRTRTDGLKEMMLAVTVGVAEVA